MSAPRKRYVYQQPILETGDVAYLRWEDFLKLHHEEDDESVERLTDWLDQRKSDLVDIDGMGVIAAKRRALVEIMHLYPPPGYSSRKRLPKRLDDGKVAASKAHRQAAQEAADLGLGPTPELDASTLPEGLAWASNDPTHFVADAAWCYQSMHRRVGPDEAPSVGAYSLLTWARENPDAFYRQILTKAIEMNQKMEALRLDHERQLAEIEAQKELEAVRQQQMSEQEVEDLAAIIDLAAELGVPWAAAEAGMRSSGKPMPEDLRERIGQD